MAKKTSPSTADVSPKDDHMDDYESKNNFDTIMKAHDIMADEEKMSKVHKIAGRHKKVIESLNMPKQEEKKPISSLDELRKVRDSKAKKII